MKSYASMVAKVFFIKSSMNRQLQQENAFPLLLHYNYREVIWPRGELLKEKGTRDFKLSDAFGGSDADFCAKFKIPMAALIKKKNSREPREEKDRLWVYSSTR